MGKDKKNHSQESSPKPVDNITEILINAFIEFYEPASADDPEAERLTTLDIIEQMENITDVYKGIVASALREHGFKITYTDAGPFWLIKKRD